MAEMRKHGPFDPRYPRIPQRARAYGFREVGGERADWRGFLARFYPNSRRHDVGPLAAYEAYVNETRRQRTTAPPTDGRIERWEGEGGSVAAQSRPRRTRTRPGAAQEV
jgi:hypothetical protein